MATKTLNVIAFFSSVAAAGFWLWSAKIPIPNIDMDWNGHAPIFIGALKKQSQLSAAAAICAAIAALSQGIILVLKAL